MEADSVALPGFESGQAPEAVSGGVREPARRARVRARGGRRAWVSADLRRELLWICVIYLGARALLLVAAFLQASFGHHPFQNELANWDGLWYRQLANQGYPHHVSYGQTTLGFFPLYSLTIWGVEHVIAVVMPGELILSATIAGVIISGVGGLVATMLVHRLAEGWWDRDTARRATILFVLFPGAVVFSMVYSEGLLLPLAAGCIYALERRKWVLAGCLAGAATAVQPVGLVLVVACAVSALLELRRHRWRPRAAWRSFIAPGLSVAGAGAFALFLWAWTGTPFANYIAQHHGWGEKTDVLAIWHLTKRLAAEVSLNHFNHPAINLNLIVGLIGAILLAGMLVLVYFSRRQISPEAIIWTAGISFLALTSEYVPPNPRLLITAFPALMAVAHYTHDRAFRILAWTNGSLLILLSLLTFWAHLLRP